MWIGVGVSATLVLVLGVSSVGVLTTAIVGFHDLKSLGESEIDLGWEC